MTISAIETHYDGCRFRSRLEARWAVFFNHLGIQWEYEPQGYVLADGTPYLPDFLIHPNTPRALWFEVKGAHPSGDELKKAQQLATGTGISTWIYFGPIELPGPGLSRIHEHHDYYGSVDEWVWDNKSGWFLWEGGHPAAWEFGLLPTAYRLSPATDRFPARAPKSGFEWWTDCARCGEVILKWHGQQGLCPEIRDNEDPGQLYPSFRHETPRLISAYQAARSARFEHGECG